MTECLSVLDRLPETMRHPIEQYAGLIRETVGQAVRELTFFGAIAAGACGVGQGRAPHAPTF